MRTRTARRSRQRARLAGLPSLLLSLLLGVCGGAAQAQPAGAPGGPLPAGTVELPVALWSRLVEAVREPPPVLGPWAGYGLVERRIEGEFRKGLLRATLTLRFEVLAEGQTVAVPVIEGAASLAEVRLDGADASLVREDGLYVARVAGAGSHTLVVRFDGGEEQERFTRRVRFALPADGATAFAIVLPESDVEPRVAGGVVTGVAAVAGGTRVAGWTGPTGELDLAWTRRVTHRADEPARMECRVDTLFAVGESLVEGVARFDLRLREGETDRIDLVLPPAVEVVAVDGDAVLQWRTAAGPEGGTLTLLLRYLVTEDVRVAVRFQSAVEPGQPVPLRMPFAGAGVPTTGAAGVQAPTGLDVQVARLAGAEEVPPRELPAELTDRSPSPLVLGFRFTGPPAIDLTVARQGAVRLTGTVVDELEASSVLLEDGAEVSKVRLHIRNNTRQSLTVRLPPGAVLTHGVVDGQAVRPALVPDAAPGEGEALLFPLRQSVRVGADGARFHDVQPGENLGRVAYLYYADPARWPRILEANRDVLASEDDLAPGQRLRIPPEEGAKVEESRFVIELAWRRRAEPLSGLGTLAVALPALDVEVMEVTWHVYLPAAIEPLAFDGNLTPYTGLRYDPFRRLRDFLGDALGGRPAWAGAAYKSILSQRKDIFREEVGRRAGGDPVLASFPLVGERYRFKRILLGRETAHVTVRYLSHGAAAAVRWAALALAAGLGLLLLGRPRRWWRWALALAGLAALLLVAHHVGGVHRRILWGADLALVIALLARSGRAAWRGAAARLRAPWRLFEHVTLRNLVLLVGLFGIARFALAFPLLLSTSAFGALLWAWSRATHSAGAARPGEVDHATA